MSLFRPIASLSQLNIMGTSPQLYSTFFWAKDEANVTPHGTTPRSNCFQLFGIYSEHYCTIAVQGWFRVPVTGDTIPFHPIDSLHLFNIFSEPYCIMSVSCAHNVTQFPFTDSILSIYSIYFPSLIVECQFCIFIT